MPIIKSSATSNYTIIPNETLQDKLLDFDSRGLLNYMLSLPPHWEFKIANLISESPNAGRDKIKRMVKELEQSGYIVRKSKRTECGKFSGVCWIISPVRDYGKTPNKTKKTRQSAKPSPSQPSDIRKETKRNIIIKNAHEENDFFYESVLEEIQLKLQENCEKVTSTVKWYIDMKLEEYINRYPHNRSKADCCMYIINAVDSMNQKRR